MFDLRVVVKFVALAAGLYYCHVRTVGATDSNTYSKMSCLGSDNATSYVKSLRNLQDSLGTNEPLRDGSYNNTFRKNSQEFYSLIECRGDVPAAECTKCAKDLIATAFDDKVCRWYSGVQIWITWCYLLFVDKNFVSDANSTGRVVFSTSDNQDGPDVVSAGLKFMRGLASTTAEKPLMFQYASLDFQQRGKRYGMAECIRDLGASTCADCLNELVDDVTQSTLANASDWVAYGSRCAMWYHSYQFYYGLSNATDHNQPDDKDGVPASLASTRFSGGGTATSSVTAALVLLLALYIHQFD